MGIVREGVIGQEPQDADSGTQLHARGAGSSIFGINIGRGLKKGLNRGRS